MKFLMMMVVLVSGNAAALERLDEFKCPKGYVVIYADQYANVTGGDDEIMVHSRMCFKDKDLNPKFKDFKARNERTEPFLKVENQMGPVWTWDRDGSSDSGGCLLRTSFVKDGKESQVKILRKQGVGPPCEKDEKTGNDDDDDDPNSYE